MTAIQSFMPTAGNGAIAALDYNDDERRRLADKSREASTASLRSHGCASPFILPSCLCPLVPRERSQNSARLRSRLYGAQSPCLLPTICVSLSLFLSRVSLGKCVCVCARARAISSLGTARFLLTKGARRMLENFEDFLRRPQPASSESPAARGAPVTSTSSAAHGARHIFWKVPSSVCIHSKCSSALTFENVFQPCRCSISGAAGLLRSCTCA